MSQMSSWLVDSGVKIRKDDIVDESKSAFLEGGRVFYFAFVGFLFAPRLVAHVVI